MQNFRFYQFCRSSFQSNNVLLILLIFFYRHCLNSRIRLFRLLWWSSKYFLILICVLSLHYKIVLLFLSYSLNNLIAFVLYWLFSRKMFCCSLLILNRVYADCIYFCNSIHQIFLILQLNLWLRIQENFNIVYLSLHFLFVSLSLFSININDLIQSFSYYPHYFLSLRL